MVLDALRKQDTHIVVPRQKEHGLGGCRRGLLINLRRSQSYE